MTRLRFDAYVSEPTNAVADIALAERRGADRALIVETAHDPFQMLAIAASQTSTIEIGTGVAIAFARTPMTLAHSAWTLQTLSGGRAVIGLGSQIKPHITRRYSMPWSRPAARMREFVAATRAIWNSWQTGDRLYFQGDFYTHTLMTPVFAPAPLPQGAPRILIAAIGERMAETAGAVGDGVICHPICSASFLAERMLPGVRAARAAAESQRAPHTTTPFETSVSVLTATGRTEEQIAESTTALRERFAFYASTPAYRAALEHHGWGELQEELKRLSVMGRWKDMGLLITDEMLDTVGVVGDPQTVGRKISERYRDVVDRVGVALPGDDPELALDVVDAIRAAKGSVG